jgi:hypothetical protein
VQLGLRVAESVRRRGSSARVVSQDDCPGRWCWGGGPKTLTVSRASTLCCADDEVALDAGHWRRFDAAPQRVGFFIYVQASHDCSAHSSHGIFSQMVVDGRLVLTQWCFELVTGCSISLAWV